MKIDPNSPAFPVADCDQAAFGLTVRQDFAKAAMKGLLASQGEGVIFGGTKETEAFKETLANASVQMADALIAALNKEGK